MSEDYRRISPKTSHGRNKLAAFRGDIKVALPLHSLEKILLIVAILNVCSLPWMLAGMRIWAQLISLGLSVMAFGISVIPRNYEGDLIRGDAYRFSPHRKLLRWPIWWIGVVFFCYVFIQALNPAWEFVQMDNSWGMRQIDHYEWLPTSMRTPLEIMNPWRQMWIWGAPFLLACSLWSGITRRKSIVTLITVIVGNAAVLGLVGIAARITANGTILWAGKGIQNYTFASFIYKNHAGSFFALAAGLTVAMAIWHHTQAARQLKRSSPAGIFIFMGMILLIAVLMTYSRAAIIITLSFLIITIMIGGLRIVTRRTARETTLILSVFCIGVTVFLGIGEKLVSSERTLDHIRALTDSKQLDSSVISRQLAWKAGWEMGTERPKFGWGAGGFRFLFPRYQIAYPEITYIKRGRTERFTFWEHAHNDYLQSLIELGRIGVGLLVVGFVVFLIHLVRAGHRRRFPAMALGASLLMTMAHATVDFPMQNPAVLTTWFVVFVSTMLAASAPTALLPIKD